MNTSTFAALLLATASTAGWADAQVVTHKTLSLEGARSVLAACESAARSNGAGGAFAVVDDGGNLIALQRMDGTFPAGANVSIGKARTAAMFRKPTSFFEDTIRNGRTPMLALNDFTPLQGGVPIEVDGQIVGAVGVSGAMSAQQDEQIAKAGAAALTSAAKAGPMSGDGSACCAAAAGLRESGASGWWLISLVSPLVIARPLVM